MSPHHSGSSCNQRSSETVDPVTLVSYTDLAMKRARRARTQEAAQGFLKAAARAAQALPELAAVTLYPAVPLTIQRVANVERAQLLIESDSRAALQRFLSAWQPLLLQSRSAPEARGLIRFAVDVDPLTV